MVEVIIQEIKEETPNIKRFTLQAADGSRLPRFSGGSHITTYVQTEQRTIERSYSLLNDSNTTKSYQIAIRRSDSSRGGSVYWHDFMNVGDMLKISYPKNHFSISFKGKHHILIAAGIGITPFLAMAAELKRNSKSFELHYAARSAEECAFYDRLTSLYPNETHFYFSKENHRMTTDVMKHKLIGSHVYFCGPESMVRKYSEAAKAYGYPETSIHFELFAPPDLGPKQAFQVRLASSEQIIQVPAEESLLDTLLKQGINAPYSCKMGGCGSCQVDVIEGEVDHRDCFLSEDEKKHKKVMLTCVSRAKEGLVVLDL